MDPDTVPQQQQQQQQEPSGRNEGEALSNPRNQRIYEHLQEESRLLERISALQGQVQTMQRDEIRLRRERANEQIGQSLQSISDTTRDLKAKVGVWGILCYPCCVIGRCTCKYGKPVCLFTLLSTCWLVIFVLLLVGLTYTRGSGIQMFSQRQ